jgi:hypothetical protein
MGADYVTDDVDRDGLWKAFVKLGLVSLKVKGRKNENFPYIIHF